MELFDVKEYTNIDGNVTYQMPVGYCTCKLHKGYITESEAKTHCCFAKNCKYLIKNDDHSFWFRKENGKVIKRYFELIKKEYYRNEISKNDYDCLKSINNRREMEMYIESHRQDLKDEYRTISNYVAKEIIHPKKPNIVARIINTIKISYNKWKKLKEVG